MGVAANTASAHQLWIYHVVTGSSSPGIIQTVCTVSGVGFGVALSFKVHEKKKEKRK